jgi:hypothetical protein
MDAVPPPIKYDETARTKIVKVVRLRKLPKELLGVESACATWAVGRAIVSGRISKPPHSPPPAK